MLKSDIVVWYELPNTFREISTLLFDLEIFTQIKESNNLL